MTDGFRGIGFAAAGAGDGRGEEIFQLEQAAGRGDVFIRGDAAHGAFVHADGGGDVAQVERAQQAHAVLEKRFLLRHDLRRDFQDRVGALVERLHQPVGRTQALGQVRLVGRGRRRRRDARVVTRVHQYARQRVGVELDEPAALGTAAHEDVRHHGLCELAAEGEARLRVQALDLGDHVEDVVLALARHLAQARDVVARDEVEAADDRLHGGVETVLLAQLQGQALAERTREYARRI